MVPSSESQCGFVEEVEEPRDRLGKCPIEDCLVVVFDVGAYTRKMFDERDLEPFQFRCRPNAAKL